MRWGSDLLELAERFQVADGIDAAWLVLRRELARFGGTDAGYGYCWHGCADTAPGELLLHYDYPQSFLDQYDEAGHVEHDWSVLHAISEPYEFYVSTDRRALQQMTPRQLQVEHDAYEVDLHHVVTMPLRDSGNGAGGLTVAFRGTAETEFDGIIAAHEEDLRRIGLLFHGAIRQQPGLGGLIDLSRREREVLTWTAAGSSSKVIAHRLNLSARTVEHHIASAAKRLGAHNRTHAVAKALVLNLISP